MHNEVTAPIVSLRNQVNVHRTTTLFHIKPFLLLVFFDENYKKIMKKRAEKTAKHTIWILNTLFVVLVCCAFC